MSGFLPVCPAAGGGRCAASRCDGVLTPPRMPGLCRPAAGSETSGWCTGSPTECGSLGWGSPSTEAAHTANPGEETWRKKVGVKERGGVGQLKEYLHILDAYLLLC